MRFKKIGYINFYPEQNDRVSSIFDTKEDAIWAADSSCEYPGLQAELSFDVIKTPKTYKLVFYADGRCECLESGSIVIPYKGKPPIKVIKVREVES